MFNSNWLLTFYSVHWLEGVCVKVFSLYRCLDFFCVDFQGFFCPNSAKVSCHLPVPQLWVISVDFGSLIFYSRQTLSPSQLPVSSNFWLLRTKILLPSSPPSSGNSQIPWPRSIHLSWWMPAVFSDRQSSFLPTHKFPHVAFSELGTFHTPGEAFSAFWILKCL